MSLDEVRRELGEVRTRLGVSDDAARDAAARLAAVDKLAAEAGPDAPDDLAAARKQYESAIGAARDELSQLGPALADALGRLDALGDPEDLVAQLDDDVPFLLVPVRLETRFRDGPRGPELLVRVFPDDVAVDAFEPALTEAEEVAGRTYWADAGAAAARDARLAAWSRLVALAGPSRAAWIAVATRGGALTGRAPAAWARPARARLLPDRFVFLARNRDGRTQRAVGRVIPEDLAVGPDPASPGFVDEEGGFVVPPPLRWLTDFAEAERVGMAARVPITAEDARTGFDNLLVLGVSVSSDAADGAARVEQLVSAHHYSDGLSLVPVGTPTNVPAGTVRPTPAAVVASTFRVEQEAPLLREGDTESDGAVLAAALGIDAAIFGHVEHADGTDARDARSANRALWPATLGYYLTEMLAPVVSRDRAEEVRRFFLRWVTARGPLPSVRTGRQPYGVLPTTVYSRLRWDKQDPDGPLLSTLQAVLDAARPTWAGLAEQTARVGHGDDADAALLEILEANPSAVAVSRRSSLGPDYLRTVMQRTKGNRAARAWSRAARAAAAEALVALGLPLDRIPKILDIEFLDPAWPLPPAFVDAAPASETRRLPAASTDGRNYVRWLAEATVDALVANDLGIGPDGTPVAAPPALLYSLLRQALLLSHWEAAAQVAVADGVIPVGALVERELHGLGRDEPVGLSRLDHLDLVVQRSGGRPLKTWLQTDAGRSAPEAMGLASVQQAIASLADRSTAALERLLTEHLDLCSHRLDAWYVGMAGRRLHELRSERPRGVYVGAYGWLEDVRPGDAPREVAPDASALAKDTVLIPPHNAGFVHAPSLAQATTAAILRNASLSHPDRAERFAVNLSSERARRAASLLDSVRAGESLTAVLGVRIERALHADVGNLLSRYVFELRRHFPWRHADDTSEAPTVVNGLALLGASRSVGYPYGVDGLPAAGSAAARAVERVVAAAADDFDAIGDLVVAEAVHQTVRGNPERAAAILRSAAEGGHPPEPQVLSTPAAGTGVTHRVAVLLDASGDGGPWRVIPATPRSAASPMVDAWLSHRLGPPSDIRWLVRSGGTTATMTPVDAGLRAIDLVHLLGSAAGGDELRRHAAGIARRRSAADTDVSVSLAERDPTWPASVVTPAELHALAASATAMLATARPMTGDDLHPPRGGAPDAAGTDLAALVRHAGAAVRALEEAIEQLGRLAPSGSSDALLDAMVRVWSFGVSDACLPAETEGRAATAARAESAVGVGRQRVAAARASLRTAETSVGRVQLAAVLDVFRAVFGSAVPVAAGVSVARPTEVADAIAANDPLAVERWAETAAAVRPAVRALVETRLLGSLVGGEPPPVAVLQLPRRSGEPWVGGPMPGRVPTDVVSIVAELPRADLGPVIAGVVVDEWVETVPEPTQLTGLAFHYDAPGGEAPQALLVVVPPVRTGRWSWPDLVDAVTETFDLARVRTVDPDAIHASAYAQLLPAIVSATSTAPVTIVADGQWSARASALLAAKRVLVR